MTHPTHVVDIAALSEYDLALLIFFFENFADK